MISKKKKIIFVHIPKTGGSSIEKCLKNVFDERILMEKKRAVGEQTKVLGEIKNLYKNSHNSLKHSTIMELKNHYSDEDFNEFHKFAVIRNPWDRLLSLYSWPDKTKYNKKSFLKYFKGVKEVDAYKKRALWTINKFVCDEKGDIMVDTLLDFENLNNDFMKLNSKLGLTEDTLPHINRTKVKSFREVMDEETIEIVRRYYKKEIDKFW